ncbi:hypothetical protein CsatB_011730 [Cannabis sativa]|uniref:Translation initiation factor IF-1, chloroplastic n=1 Tax=Cannabis sativa TaxID=3483 RepID=A0A7J6HCY0_CANSA|nr:hypothetical protein F8388_006593 [Cannabis sativa]KAF4392925.1 hypothetical protein G4B88_011920 [Cannabis sativa]
MWSSGTPQQAFLHLPLGPRSSTTLIPISAASANFPEWQQSPLCWVGCVKRTPLVGVVMAKAPGSKDSSEQQKWTQEGLVTESLPNGMFRIKLDNEDMIIGYISGKIRKSFIRILPGDRVNVEVSRYDSTRGRIIYRLRSSKDPS